MYRDFQQHHSRSQNRTPPWIHKRCRSDVKTPYERDKSVFRTPVPEDKIPWSVGYPDYEPVDFTMPKILKGTGYSDPNIAATKSDLLFNEIDGKLDRRSFMGKYKLENGIPLNPMGRTGMKGRGALGRWGPNHAADPVVTRWKRNADGSIVEKDGKPVLEFVSILRGKSNEWALPGGMVDAGEQVTSTLRREFAEEAMDGHSLTEEERKTVDKKVEENFCSGVEIYKGYVDDPRNTDNAWMETVAVNFHDESGDGLGRFDLTAGDDAVGVRWTAVDNVLNMYANHGDFVKRTVEVRKAYWPST